VLVLQASAVLVKLSFMIQKKKVDGFGKLFMPLQQKLPGIRRLESPEEFFETRLEAIGYIFHGSTTESNGKPHSGRSSSNLLHFARCAKLDKVGTGETKIWFRTAKVAHKHLDEVIGRHGWKWCKVCQREITQRILDET
jgi:hypothetical protein